MNWRPEQMEAPTMGRRKGKGNRRSEAFIRAVVADLRDLGSNETKDYCRKRGIPVGDAMAWVREASGESVRRDSRGRVKSERPVGGGQYSYQFKALVVSEIDGLGGARLAAYAKENGIPSGNLYRWRKQKGKIMAAAEAEAKAEAAIMEAATLDAAVEAEAAGMDLETERLKARCDTLATDNRRLVGEVQSMTTRCETLKVERDALLLANKSLKAERDRAMRNLELAQGNVRLRDKRLKEARETIARLEGKVKRLDDGSKNEPVEMGTIRELRRKLAIFEKSDETLRANLAVAQRVASHRTAELEIYKKLDGDDGDLRAQLAQSQKEAEGLRAAVARLKAVVADFYMKSLDA